MDFEYVISTVRTWWINELPSETALLDDPESFFRSVAQDIEDRRSVLMLSGYAKPAAYHRALDELLPSRADLDPSRGTPQQLEARAGDFVSGALAFIAAENARKAEQAPDA